MKHLYLVACRLLRIDGLEHGGTDLSANVAEIPVLLKVLHHQVLEFVQLFHGF